MGAEMSCFDALHELDEAMADVVPSGMNYVVLGGIASSALRHLGTNFETLQTGGIVHAPVDAAEPVIRGNGTKRDVDLLVTGLIDEVTAVRIKNTVTEAVNGQLVVSVFAFDEHVPKPSLLDKAKAAVSHRTIDEQGVMRYELYPLTQIVSPETYEPWTMMTPKGMSVQVLHPAGTALAYGMRSISGIRPKDTEKVKEMMCKVLAVPAIREAVYEGPFSDWLAFAEAIPRISSGQMDVHDGILRPGTSRAELAAFRLKGRLLHWLESKEGIVRLAQNEDGPLEKALNLFVRAK